MAALLSYKMISTINFSERDVCPSRFVSFLGLSSALGMPLCVSGGNLGGGKDDAERVAMMAGHMNGGRDIYVTARGIDRSLDLSAKGF